MKSVSANFQKAELDPASTRLRQIYYKRRYWNQTTLSYSYEANWNLLPESQVKQVPQIVWQLDTQQFNNFKVSNLAFSFDNSRGQWNPSNPAGYFGGDAFAPMGYEPYWTKFQVRCGYQYADGTTETVTIFTGVLTNPQRDSAYLTQINVEGEESYLLNSNAENIATKVTNESTGTGNGSTTAFNTLQPGVGRIVQVALNGIQKIEGSDYTVSNLNVSSAGATITFTTAPGAGVSIKTTYAYWPQGLSFDAVVKNILTTGGIVSANQNVQPITFPNNVLNTVLFKTQSDWSAGTLSQMLATDHPGQIDIDWANGANSTAGPSTGSAGNFTLSQPGTATVTSDGTYLILNGGSSGNNAAASFTQTGIAGGFGFKYTFASGTGVARYYFTDDTYLIISGAAGGGVASPNTIVLVKGGSSWSVNFTSGSTEHIVTLVNYGDRAVVTVDGSTIFNISPTIAANASTTGQIQFNGISATFKVRTITVPVATGSGTWTTTIDCTTAPSSWGTMDHVEDNAGATTPITYWTRSSTDNATWDSWIQLPNSNIPQSALKRYLQIQVRMNYPTSTWPESSFWYTCATSQVTFRFTTSSTALQLPNMTGLDCYTAIQKIADFCQYEYGFNPDETFFLRPRPNSRISLLSLDQGNYIMSVSNLVDGYDRVYSTCRAVYGNYTKDVGGVGQARQDPLARFSYGSGSGGNDLFQLNADVVLQVPSTADIATGVAAKLYALLYRPKRRAKIKTLFLPQLDLSDTIDVTYMSALPSKQWFLGDSSVNLGESDINLYGAAEQLLYKMPCRVIGARYDTDTFTCEFDIEEIL